MSTRKSGQSSVPAAYHHRNQAIHRLSELLLADHSGAVPANLEASNNRGGPQTASVVMAQAFGMPTFPVDTPQSLSVQRGRPGAAMSDGRDLKRLSHERWNALHLQIIYYGGNTAPPAVATDACEITLPATPPESTPNVATRPEYTGNIIAPLPTCAADSQNVRDPPAVTAQRDGDTTPRASLPTLFKHNCDTVRKTRKG